MAGCEQDAATLDEMSDAGSPGASAGGTSSSPGEAGATSTEGGAPMSPEPTEGGAPSEPSGGTGGASAGSSQGGSAGGPLGYLPCESKQDCDEFGGGKICCAVGAMHFCTKQSACPGDTLP